MEVVFIQANPDTHLVPAYELPHRLPANLGACGDVLSGLR